MVIWEEEALNAALHLKRGFYANKLICWLKTISSINNK